MTAFSALLNNTGWAFYPRRCLRPRYQFFFTFAKGGGGAGPPGPPSRSATADPLGPCICNGELIQGEDVRPTQHGVFCGERGKI